MFNTVYSKERSPCCLRYLLIAASDCPLALQNPDKTTVKFLLVFSWSFSYYR